MVVMVEKITQFLIISAQKHFVEDVRQKLIALPTSYYTAISSSQAFTVILKHHIDIVVIDVDIDNSQLESGYDIASRFTKSDSAKSIPIILVGSNLPDEKNMHAYQTAGQVAYICKPIIPTILTQIVLNFMSIIQVKNEYQQLADESTLLKLELSRRNKQLALSSQIARQISSILNLDNLLYEIVQLIQREFKYYYVSIWLISADKKTVELKVGSFEGGSSTLEPGFRLHLNRDRSIITHVCNSLTMYLAQNTNKDPYYLSTDALPETKAELTLPLLAKGILLGVIDIESDRSNVFHPDDVEILSTLADQTAIAIRNASLYNAILRSSEDLEERISIRTQELQETNQQLELLERNKSDFIQVLSHELRTPLTLVSGYAELLLTHHLADSDPLFRQPIEGIMTGAQRLHELIDSMVDMLKIDSRSLQLMPQHIVLESVITPIIAKLEDAFLKRKLFLEIWDIDSLPEIDGDLDLLGKVFEHLLLNAIKYTPDGGQITIKGRHLQQNFEDGHEEFIEISITDTGIGISPEYLDVIFTKFYRTGDVSQHSSGKIKFKGGGPGLGLSIAQGIVEAHQGRIWAESPGYDEKACPGSCFYVLLPVKQK